MKKTWVIGGTSGIGAATADLLGKDDGRWVYSSGQEADVKLHGEFEQMYIDIVADGGELDEIVYSAGINQLMPIEDLNFHSVKEIFETNTIGFMRLLYILQFQQASPCRIVVVSSDAARRPMRMSMAYCASKAALDMAIKCSARELAHLGYRINGVAPGMTHPTDMSNYIDEIVPRLRGWTPEEAANYENSQAVVKRRATPEEIAETVKMVLEAPDYLNGSILEVNGGR